MAKKAVTFQLVKETAQLMLLEKVPQVAGKTSGPLTSTNKVTLASLGSGAMRVARMTCEVLNILSHCPESVDRLTGVSSSQVDHEHLQTA